MTVPKPLYLAKNIGELQARGKVGDTSKLKVKNLCESAEKVLKAAFIEEDLGDEEKSYISFFKYIELIQLIKAKAEFKRDEQYFKSMYNIPKNFKRAVEALQSLTASLTKRYELGNFKFSKLSKNKFDINSNENLTSTPISALNGASVKDVTPAKVENYLINHKQLYNLVSQKSTSFLLLDTRKAEEYSDSHLTLEHSLNIPEQLLERWPTAATLGKSLCIQDRCQWDRRGQVDKLIIFDWVSDDFHPGSPVTVLRDALTQWDVGCQHKNAPYLLEGGYQKFLYAYPHLVTNPKARAPSETKAVVNVYYPDLDAGFLVTQTPKIDRSTKPTLVHGRFQSSPQLQPYLESQQLQGVRHDQLLEEILEEQEKLVKEKEEVEKKTLEELKKLKLQLKEKDEKVQKNEEDRKRLEQELKQKKERQKEMLECPVSEEQDQKVYRCE